MASPLDSLLNNLVGRLGEFGIGRGTAAQQPVGPSYQDYSGDIYNSYKPLNPVPRQKYNFDRYEQPTVRFTSGMLGGQPIQVEQEIPPIPPPDPTRPPVVPDLSKPLPSSMTPPVRTSADGRDVSLEPPAIRDVRPPVMDDYSIGRESPIGSSGLLTGDLLSMTRKPSMPSRQEFSPQRGANTQTRDRLVPPPPRGMLDLGIESPDMFRGQLGMPPPVQYPTYGDEYENLKGKSIEEIRLELKNPKLDVNENGDLVEPTFNRFGEVISEKVIYPSFAKDKNLSSPTATLADQAVKDLTTEEQLDEYLDNLQKETEGFKIPKARK
jgi:hypothetical protein